MTATTQNTAALLVGAEVDELLIKPTLAESVTAQVARVVRIDSTTFRMPVVNTDPSASWVAEGNEIPVSDADIDEVLVEPRKLAGLSIITSELAEDSDPAAAEEVGRGLARDLARKMDAAFFGNIAGGIAPTGLGGLSGTTTVDAGDTWANLDAFTTASLNAETAGTAITTWVANAATAAALFGLREATGSNKGLLAADPTQPARRLIEGAPLLISPAVANGVVWGVPADRVTLVIRRDATVRADASVFFTSDRIAVRATMRVGFGFPDPASVQQVKVTP